MSAADILFWFIVVLITGWLILSIVLSVLRKHPKWGPKAEPLIQYISKKIPDNEQKARMVTIVAFIFFLWILFK